MVNINLSATILILYEKYVDNAIQIILPIESILNEDYLINSDGVFEYRERRCSYCSSNHVHKKGYAWTTIFF